MAKAVTNMALAAIFVLCIGVVAGCSGSTSAEPPTTPTTEPPPTSTTTTTAPPTTTTTVATSTTRTRIYQHTVNDGGGGHHEHHSGGHHNHDGGEQDSQLGERAEINNCYAAVERPVEVMSKQKPEGGKIVVAEVSLSSCPGGTFTAYDRQGNKYSPLSGALEGDRFLWWARVLAAHGIPGLRYAERRVRPWNRLGLAHLRVCQCADLGVAATASKDWPFALGVSPLNRLGVGRPPFTKRDSTEPCALAVPPIERTSDELIPVHHEQVTVSPGCDYLLCSGKLLLTGNSIGELRGGGCPTRHREAGFLSPASMHCLVVSLPIGTRLLDRQHVPEHGVDFRGVGAVPVARVPHPPLAPVYGETERVVLRRVAGLRSVIETSSFAPPSRLVHAPFTNSLTVHLLLKRAVFPVTCNVAMAVDATR